MLLFLILIASVCFARPSKSNDMSSDIFSNSCESGLDKCQSVTAHCSKKKGIDAAKCICDAGSKLIQCGSHVSECSPKEKKEIVELLSMSSKLMCEAAKGRRDHSREVKDVDDVRSLPKARKPAFGDDEDLDDLETFGEKDDFDFRQELDERNSTNSANSTNSTEPKSGSAELSKSVFFISMLYMIAL